MLPVCTFSIILTILTLSFNNLEAAFPDDPKPCNYGDHECMVKLVNHAIKTETKDDNLINVSKLDPLTVPHANLVQGADSPVNINLTFTDSKIFGLKNATILEMDGFTNNINSKHKVVLKTDRLILIGDYEIAGKVLVLPIKGVGKSNITISNITYIITFDGVAVEKDGATYMKAVNFKLDSRPTRVYYHFDNLFNGDKALGDTMNDFLNENWSDIHRELKPLIDNTLASIFGSVIENILLKHPYEKLFKQ